MTNKSDRRLILFDVDGTLVSGGPAKEAFHHALLTVFGTAGPILDWEFSGKTDPQIARELLTEAGLDPEVIDEGFPELWKCYLAAMEARLPYEPLHALPGVIELIEALGTIEPAIMGLLTGNVIHGAGLKLRSAGISRAFPVGAFGSDHEVRRELPAIAVKRANRTVGIDFPPREVVVVGDTPRDVDCGQYYGTRTVAVATGRFDTMALERTGADVVLNDLEDTREVVEALFG